MNALDEARAAGGLARRRRRRRRRHRGERIEESDARHLALEQAIAEMKLELKLAAERHERELADEVEATNRARTEEHLKQAQIEQELAQAQAQPRRRCATTRPPASSPSRPRTRRRRRRSRRGSRERRRLCGAEAERERAESHFVEALAQRQLAAQLRDRLQEVQQRRRVQLQREAQSRRPLRHAVVAALARCQRGARRARSLGADDAQQAPRLSGANGTLEVGTLRVHLQSGEGLKAADDNGLSDPYVKFVLGQKCVSSKMAEDARSGVERGAGVQKPDAGRGAARADGPPVLRLGRVRWGWGMLRALIGSLEGGVETTVKLDDGRRRRARCG